LLGLAAFDDLADAVFQLGLDVSIAAFFGVDLDLRAPLTILGDSDVTELLLCLPAGEQRVGRLAGVACEVVGVRVRELRVAVINYAHPDSIRVGLSDVGQTLVPALIGLRYWSRLVLLVAFGGRCARVADDPVLVRDPVAYTAPWVQPW
jgi:hypothetical protein